MNKLSRRGCFALSTIAAALVLLAGVPADALAAGEESSGGSTPGGVVVEPSGGSTQPAVPPSTEWSPQGSDGGASRGDAAPLQHGSSVGSGVVPGKAEPKSEPPSYNPNPGVSYEPEPSTPAQAPSSSPPPSTLEPVSTPQERSGSQPEQPTAATAPTTSRLADVGVADAVARSAPPQDGDVDSAPTAAAAAALTDSGDRESGGGGSYILPLLVILAVLGVILRYAYIRVMRERRRQQLEALWREQDEAWEAAIRRAELRQVPVASEPSAQPLQRVNAA